MTFFHFLLFLASTFSLCHSYALLASSLLLSSQSIFNHICHLRLTLLPCIIISPYAYAYAYDDDDYVDYDVCDDCIIPTNRLYHIDEMRQMEDSVTQSQSVTPQPPLSDRQTDEHMMMMMPMIWIKVGLVVATREGSK